MKKLVFLCGARDYHAMDWYRSALKLFKNTQICILTDLITGEGFKKIILDTDRVHKLIVIDSVLFKKQTSIGNIWRNLVKFVIIPFQVYLIIRFDKKHPESIYYAHSMYYIWLAWLAKVEFIGVPQGSDILIKPFRSKIYKFLTVKALRAARRITVDSDAMAKIVADISGVRAAIVQNGIDMEGISKARNHSEIATQNRSSITSIRGMTPLYQITEILKSRNATIAFHKIPITFIYPFYEANYCNEVKNLMIEGDMNLGRVDRDEMYNILLCSEVIISIPKSDSSPRSVYESIFCGAIILASYNKYIDNLPNCMKERVVLVDLTRNDWFEKGMAVARGKLGQLFIPSKEAIEMFDQARSFKVISQMLAVEND